MAELLLLANPNMIRTHGDGMSLSVDFDSIADLRSWLRLAGLDSPDLLTGERNGTTDDGRPYRRMNAYPTWHGWEIYASAKDYTDASPLDPTTTDRLTALTVEVPA
ncbi:hypothetical protein [Micromonospora echinofusca]|uniref:Uncharacterized protein n=1 Tax=Micromonospora echinofusca TaxID=47858 RepID=A0ABS3VTS4_MICEH|nr:hypothetical protein [Micromonospora echinofusca]MBO4207944.1 hypothetical protein [Micromonospora echinofusca]